MRRTWYRVSGIEACPNIMGYLETVARMRERMGRPEGWSYSSPDDFIHRHGRPFPSAPLSDDEKVVVASLLKRRRCYKPKQCHYNAQDISMSSQAMQLVEGYVFSIIPIYHSWNSLNGKVIDFTLRDHGNPILGVLPEGWEYFGVAIPSSAARGRWIETGSAGPVIDDFERGFPMLQKEFKDDNARTAGTADVWGDPSKYRGDYGLV